MFTATRRLLRHLRTLWPLSALLLLTPGAAASDYTHLKSDETLRLHRADARYLSESDEWELDLHAWVFEPQDSSVRLGLMARILSGRYELELSESSRPYFEQRVNLLIADNERGKSVVVDICGQRWRLQKTPANGRSHNRLRIAAEKLALCQTHNKVLAKAVLKPGDNRAFSGELRLLPEHGVSVISDIDDTIKITEVRNRRDLLQKTFFEPFAATPGMPEAYSALAALGIEFHYVSSSPWQLYDPLREFVDAAGYPWASFSLKQVRFKDKTLFDLFKKGRETKPQQILEIIKRFPQRHFILIGDSGEEDPEVYGELMRRHPANVLGIGIRNVTGESLQNPRFTRAFEALPLKHLLLFENATDLPPFVAKLLENPPTAAVAI